MAVDRPLRVFALYRESPQRRAALAAPRGAPARYLLFGYDQLTERGVRVEHNLQGGETPPGWARLAGAGLQRAVHGLGGYGGDFARVLPALRPANRADVVLSTVDTVGIPLLALARAGLVRAPIVYVSIGLLPRLEGLRSRRIVREYARVLRRAAALVAYGAGEAAELEEWLGGGRVAFVPFGVDTGHFRPSDAPADVDVLSIGADPRRDFELLVRVAESSPGLSFRIVVSEEHARSLSRRPPNLELESELPFDLVPERLARAKVVALPVRENSYSGATTTLLQAMACGKPVVVSRTAAIATGYHLADGDNVRLVPPGDAGALERAIVELLRDPQRAATLGARARETAERHLSWRRYVDSLHGLLVGAAAPGAAPA